MSLRFFLVRKFKLEMVFQKALNYVDLLRGAHLLLEDVNLPNSQTKMRCNLLPHSRFWRKHCELHSKSCWYLFGYNSYAFNKIPVA